MRKEAEDGPFLKNMYQKKHLTGYLEFHPRIAKE